jgi:carbon storage regulator
MLILTRKSQEVVVVGGADGADPMVTITVLDIGNGKVRLGIETADNIPVHRLEVWQRIRAGEKIVQAPETIPVRGPPAEHDPWA